MPFTTWSNYPVFLDLSFLICKMEISELPLRSWVCCLLSRPGSLEALSGSCSNEYVLLAVRSTQKACRICSLLLITAFVHLKEGKRKWRMWQNFFEVKLLASLVRIIKLYSVYENVYFVENSSTFSLLKKQFYISLSHTGPIYLC